VFAERKHIPVIAEGYILRHCPPEEFILGEATDVCEAIFLDYELCVILNEGEPYQECA
jgi:hypothetical protein